MEGAFRDLAVREGFDANHLGFVYSNGKAHSCLDGFGFAWATSGRSATGRRHARPAPTAKREARWEARITAAEPPELAATLNLPISPGQLGLTVHCEDAGLRERITTISLLCVLRE